MILTGGDAAAIGKACDFVDGVLVVDTSSLTVSTSLPMSNLPHGVAVHPGLDRLYVTQIDSDSVKVVNTVNAIGEWSVDFNTGEIIECD